MSEDISRQAAISLAKDICVPTKEGSIYRHRCIDPDAIRELPSAQPEIIRCKDCKWCEDADGLMCQNPVSWVVATDCDFGCVCGERRQDE